MIFPCLKLLFFFTLVKVIEASANKYGILAAESALERENFCIIFFQEFVSLPEEKSEAELYTISDTSSIDWCNSQMFDSKNKILLLTRNNCSVSEQAQNVQDQGGKGILFIASHEETDIPINETLAKHINIIVGLISENSVKILHKMGDMERMGVSGRMFSPANLNFDYSLLVIWIIAVFSVAVGSYWSGHIRLEIYSDEIGQLPAVSDTPVTTTQVKNPNTIELSSINVSSASIVFFVLCMGVMLLVLYFIFDYFVYIIIGLFVLATLIAVYGCLEPLVLKIPSKHCLFPDVQFCRGQFSYGDFDFRKAVLAVFSIASSLTWFFLRKHTYAWILQDLLGVAFCIHMLKSIRLPSLKICTVLLVLLFFYDIFFVFVTPFLTHKGESVMEEVATGGKSDETLPMVLKVVHFKFNALAVCYKQYSILGFGDILVPGLLISYCHGFDLIINKKRLYFPITVMTYGMGLLITFVALFLMNTAQPALLYLVPTTLIPTIVLGWCRGELKLLWNGFKVLKAAKSCDESIDNNSTVQISNESQVHAMDIPPVAGSVERPSEVRGEKDQLLQ